MRGPEAILVEAVTLPRPRKVHAGAGPFVQGLDFPLGRHRFE